MRARSTFLAFGLAALVGAGAVVARAQDDKKDAAAKGEYIQVPLVSVFHPDLQREARLEQGLYINGPRSNDQAFRVPVEVPVGATIVEVGLIGQTSNQMSVRLERADWSPVYAGGETQPKEAGSWTCLSLVDKSLARKVGKPVPDSENIPHAKRESTEQGFTVVVNLARDPNLSPETKAAAAGVQKDKVTALWVKIAR